MRNAGVRPNGKVQYHFPQRVGDVSDEDLAAVAAVHVDHRARPNSVVTYRCDASWIFSGSTLTCTSTQAHGLVNTERLNFKEWVQFGNDLGVLQEAGPYGVTIVDDFTFSVDVGAANEELLTNWARCPCSDCNDCGPRESANGEALCSNGCGSNSNLICEDGFTARTPLNFANELVSTYPFLFWTFNGLGDTFCRNTCASAGDGVCDDGMCSGTDHTCGDPAVYGNASLTAVCGAGTDCEDCGPRQQDWTLGHPSSTRAC